VTRIAQEHQRRQALHRAHQRRNQRRYRLVLRLLGLVP
jgi:hypothetical protein